MNHRHLTELLTEGRFTTAEIYFPAAVARTAPAQPPAKPRAVMSGEWDVNAPPWPTPGRLPFGAIKNGVLSPNEMQQMQVAFPFIARQIPDKTYVFKVTLELSKELKTGDSVVIPSSRGEGYDIAKVWTVHPTAQIDYESNHNYKWVVQRVDAENYLENLAREEQFREVLVQSEKARRRAEVRSSLLAQLTPTDPEGYAAFVDAMKLLGVNNPETIVQPPAAPVEEQTKGSAK